MWLFCRSKIKGCIMKTTQIMKRVIGVNVEQNHKNESVNLTKFVKDFKDGLVSGNVDLLNLIGWQDTDNTSDSKVEKIPTLEHYYKQEVKHVMENFLNLKSTQGLINVLDEDGEFSITTKRGQYGGTWVSKYLFLSFLTTISPRIHLHAMKLLDDDLLGNRDKSGESFKGLTSAIKLKFNPEDCYCYARVASMIGKAVNPPMILNEKGKYIFNWNEATKEQLEARDKLHTALTFMILDDMLVNLEHVYQYLNKKIDK